MGICDAMVNMVLESSSRIAAAMRLSGRLVYSTQWVSTALDSSSKDASHPPSMMFNVRLRVELQHVVLCSEGWMVFCLLIRSELDFVVGSCRIVFVCVRVMSYFVLVLSSMHMLKRTKD